MCGGLAEAEETGPSGGEKAEDPFCVGPILVMLF